MLACFPVSPPASLLPLGLDESGNGEGILAGSRLCRAEFCACSVFAVGVPGACSLHTLEAQLQLGLGWAVVSAGVRALCEVGWDHSVTLAEGFLWDRQGSWPAAGSTLLQSCGEQLPRPVPRAVCGPSSSGLWVDGHSCARAQEGC